MKNVEIPKWLKGLPLAPEFRPTDTEFADPIAYISKIEKEASVFGICKVIPPLAKPSKKYVVHNLNKSLSKCPDLDCNVIAGNLENDGDVDGKAVFTTRHQELGNGSKKVKQSLGAAKQVWQSGEVYTLEQFEAKSKQFSRSLLGGVKDVSPLATEAMFWKAASEKPIYIEYANDVPGTGFAEPEGSFRYFRRHRRRRKRGTFDRNNRGNSVSRDDQVDTVNSNSVDAGSFSNDSPNLGSNGSRDSISLPFDQPTCTNRRRSSNDGIEAEGSAGWKLSNSPWNLQVIARSPGSLTRFMPDDIPGVTSPMVYLGMLFSWFAWHVEDHELHSMNFLHMGSAKTWYAVPGDYAFQFEEVIRNHAYGESTDRLAALTRLGEKTTLLSPEMLVETGIPCCRLVQNPGEFVVTFPRSYHVGFSHGFNCGEAANFGTPQWLAVAKEAAVRRAVMNYLPMLSHQQLLYLLTMSFISRVPRSLLPGVRSSRLKDRQKEERELLVKKAFIEDMFKENKLLTNLLHNCTSYRVVEWDLQSLASSDRNSNLLGSIDTVATSSRENGLSEKSSNQDLCTQMSLCMDAIDDFYADDDGFLSDFQIDSGALPCVACGILGYPFMAIVQPSEIASKDLLKNKNSTQNCGALGGIVSTSTSDLNIMVENSTADNLGTDSINTIHRHVVEASPFPQSTQGSVDEVESELPAPNDTSLVKDDLASAAPKLSEGWNCSSGFLRPRLFCLEHAIQTERLLDSRGGANILAICHSDFRKIKPHVLGVAEEIGIPFYNEEIPFDDASVEDLNLIDLATESEEHHESSEHWTSKLHINLQQNMKLRKQFPSTKVPHALALNGLFSVSSQDSNNRSLIWELRKSRSKRCYKPSVQDTSMSYQLDKFEVPVENTNTPLTGEIKQGDKNETKEAKTDCQISSEVRKVLQYSRRYKPRQLGSTSKDPASNPVTSQDIQVAGTASSEVIIATTAVSTSKSILVPVNNSTSPVFEHLNGEAVTQLGHHLHIPAITNDSESCHPSPDVELREVTNPAVKCKEIVNFEPRKSIEKDSGSNLKFHAVGMADEIEEEHHVKSPRGTFDDPACAGETPDGRSKSGNATGETEEHCAKCPRGTSEDCDCAAETPDRRSIYCDPAGENSLETSTRSEKVASTLAADRHSIPTKKQLLNDSLVEAVAAKPSMLAIDDHSPGRGDKHTGGKRKLGLQSKLVDFPTMSKKQKMKMKNDVSRKPTFSSHSILGEEDVPTLVIALEVPKKMDDTEPFELGGGNNSDRKIENILDSGSVSTSKRKRRELDSLADDQCSSHGFVKSPCEGLRSRVRCNTTISVTRPDTEQKTRKRPRDAAAKLDAATKRNPNKKNKPFKCELQGCKMRFLSKSELLLHKRNRCTHEECGKKRFSSHKNLIGHQRVHDDDRPLKCTWEGCTMSFKWAWARTEHLRLHTGERPYKCQVDGCGLTFRFVSDYSRHRRKTGHYVD